MKIYSNQVRASEFNNEFDYDELTDLEKAQIKDYSVEDGAIVLSNGTAATTKDSFYLVSKLRKFTPKEQGGIEEHVELKLMLKAEFEENFDESGDMTDKKNTPTGEFNSATPSATEVVLNFDVVDDDVTITGNLRIDVATVLLPGTIIDTVAVSTGISLEETLTGLSTGTNYVATLVCDYNDTVMPALTDYELGRKTFTTL